MRNRDVSQFLMHWCSVFRSSEEKPNQMKLFISGGAGTGKSHLIESIYQKTL